MDIKESSIFFNEENKMYKVDLGFNTRFFDYLIYSNNFITRRFGKKNIITNDLIIDKNISFGFTNAFGGIIFNIFNLDTFENIYRFVSDVNLFSFNIKGKNYYILIYNDIDNNIGYYTDFDEYDFEIIIENKTIYIKNKIFEINVFKNGLNFKEILEYNFGLEIDRSIIDFYFFSDIFSKNNYDVIFNDFEKIFSNSCIYLQNKYNTKSFSINTDNINDILEFKKVILTFCLEQFVYYPPSDIKIKKIFSDVEDISNIEIDKLNFDFKIIENIYSYDVGYKNFQKNIIKLQYIIYDLKISYEKVLKEIKEQSNIHLELTNKRLHITKENLEKNIKHYEKIYNEFFNKINIK